MLRILLILSLLVSTGHAEEIPYIDFQKPNQLDCQMIEIDHRDYGGKLTYAKVCFYEVTFAQNRKVIMWVNVNNNNYGFIQEKK